jgi:hypothetical protein
MSVFLEPGFLVSFGAILILMVGLGKAYREIKSAEEREEMRRHVNKGDL